MINKHRSGIRGGPDMKRILSVLAVFLVLFLAAGTAMADPLVLDDDLTDTLVVLYNPDDPSAGSYTYTYRYPHVSENEPDAGKINPFYEDQIYTLETNIHFMADGYIDSGKNVTVNVTYQCTCNNDRFFSVLVRKDSVIGDDIRTVWSGHTFSRQDDLSDSTFDLPRMLGILSAGEQDEYQLARQTEKASRIVRGMIMDQIAENRSGLPYYADFSEDDLLDVFYPEEDFYLDGDGNPVFYLEPGIAADESAGYLFFPVRLEDIADEL